MVVNNEKFNRLKMTYILSYPDEIKRFLRDKTIEDNEYHLDAILNKYLKNSKKIDDIYNEIKVNYKQKNDGIGRFYAEGQLSMQSLPREIREAISDDLYYDIDIKNCHPEILKQYCVNNNIECKRLTTYCKKRDEIINSIMNDFNMTKEEVKEGLLSLLNGGIKFFNKVKKSEYIKELNNELKIIQQNIYEKEEKYRLLGEKSANTKKKEGGFYNPLGSCINMLLQDIENNILQCMIDYLENQNIINSYFVRVFDGFMILKDDVQNLDELLKELENEVKLKTKYQIKLINKLMDKKIIFCEELMNTISNSKNNLLIAMNDADAAKILFNEIKDDIIKCDGIYYFKYDNVWVHDMDELTNLLIKKLNELDIKKYKRATSKETKTETIIYYNGCEYCQNKYEDYSKNIKSCKNIIESVFPYVKTDDDFILKVYSSTKGKIFFNNGYYDLIKNEFSTNYQNIYTTKKINRDYKPNFLANKEDKIKEIYDRVLNPIFGNDLINNVLLFTSRSIAGMTGDKNFSLMMGERDCGKSKYKNLCESAFQKYVGILNMNSLLLNNSSSDESKKLSWLVDSYDTRILFASEVKLDGSQIDGNLLKMLCSGSDKIKMRKNFKDEKDFYIQCSLILLCNDLPTIKPSDTYESMVPFNCPSKFVDNITNDDKINNPHYKLKDNSIDGFVSDPDIGEVFSYMIMEQFKNYKVTLTENQKTFLESIKTDNEYQKFHDEFNITRNPKDRVSTQDLKHFLETSKMNISLAKLTIYLQNRGCVFKKQIKFQGKNLSGFEGIKIKEFDENDNNNL